MFDAWKVDWTIVRILLIAKQLIAYLRLSNEAGNLKTLNFFKFAAKLCHEFAVLCYLP